MDEPLDDDIRVCQIHAGDGDGAEIDFDCNGRFMTVSIFPSSSIPGQKKRSVIDEVIELLSDVASSDKDHDHYQEAVDEVVDLIIDLGRPLFKQATIAAQSASTPLVQDLQSFLSPEIATFQLLETAEGIVDIVPIDPDETYTIHGGEAHFESCHEEDLDIQDSLPRYPSKEIIIVETFVQSVGHFTGRIVVDGQEMFCKAYGPGRRFTGSSLGRELASLHQIQEACLKKQNTLLRVPQPLGYVVHTDKGHVIGFLRQWVPGSCLADIDMRSTPTKMRRKWATQICETVEYLHASGMIWGDGKASNIVVDELDDIWLIDFGGGYTKGWVDKELAETIEGDEQALGNIMDFLGVDWDDLG